MDCSDARFRAFRSHAGDIPLRAAAEEISREIDQAARFSRSGLEEFAAALRGAAVGHPSARDRALFSLMLAVSGGCSGCVARELSTAMRLGAKRAEVKAALRRGVLMAERPALIAAAEALAFFDEITRGIEAPCSDDQPSGTPVREAYPQAVS